MRRAEYSAQVVVEGYGLITYLSDRSDHRYQDHQPGSGTSRDCPGSFVVVFRGDTVCEHRFGQPESLRPIIRSNHAVSGMAGAL